MRSSRIWVLTAVAAACVSSANADALTDYLNVRSKFGITSAAGTEALQTLVGSGTLEVRAVVKGVLGVDGRTILLLEVPGSQTLSVESDLASAWLRVPNTTARLIVTATRETSFSSLKAKMIAAVEEAVILSWEEDQRKKQQAAKAKQQNTVTRGPSARTGREWNLEPHEALPIYSNFIRGHNPRLTKQQADQIAHGIIGFSLQYGVDARLITAMVLVESGFNPSATSPKGAMGLGQLMPGTARGLGVRNAYDTYENLYGTVRLVRGHLDKYAATGPNGQKYGDLVLALAAYNAGSGAVKRHGGVPPYRETQNYIRKVIDWYQRLCGASG